MKQTSPAKHEPSAPWRRHALLVFAVSLTGVGLALGFAEESSDTLMAQGVCLKTGIVTFMWWLALPQLQKLNPVAVGAVGVLAIVAIVRPQVLLVLPKVAIALGPLLAILWVGWKLLKKPSR